ncbi:MAG: hypothetical protein LUG57_03490, partial [Oscillospiraceae bacterium]|nr:hypothetical protein [Oscillospiraceae bacterium]
MDSFGDDDLLGHRLGRCPWHQQGGVVSLTVNGHGKGKVVIAGDGHIYSRVVKGNGENNGVVIHNRGQQISQRVINLGLCTVLRSDLIPLDDVQVTELNEGEQIRFGKGFRLLLDNLLSLHRLRGGLNRLFLGFGLRIVAGGQGEQHGSGKDGGEQFLNSLFHSSLIQSLYYRVVVYKAPLQGLCYTVKDAVDWLFTP